MQPVPESVAVTVKLEGPAVVGVPESLPVEEFKVSPGGNAPLVTLKVNGPGVPPALMVWS